MLTEPVRGIELRRRRSRVPWIYTVYHARRRRAPSHAVSASSRSASEGTPGRPAARTRRPGPVGSAATAVAGGTTGVGRSMTGRRLNDTRELLAAATRSVPSCFQAAYVLQIHRSRRGRRRVRPRRRRPFETGRDDRDLDLPVHARIDDGAEDDVRFLVRRFLDDGRRLAHLDQRQVVTAGDVDDDAARAGDRCVLEQRARDRAGWRRAWRGPRRRRRRCP